MKKIIVMLMLCAPMAVMAQKFGQVDTQSVMSTLPEVKKIEGEMNALGQQYQNDLKAMQDEIQRKAEEYEKSKATMSATQQKETETTLQDLYQKYQQTLQQNQQEMQKQQQEKMAPIVEKIKTAIQNIGKAGQYTYIFEKGTAIYEGAGTKDVTAEVKAELNKLK